MRLAILFVFLAGVSTLAQVVMPTTRYTFEWDYDDLTKADHFEVRFTSAGAWVSVGKTLRAPVPALGVGSYSAQVRACALPVPTTATCSVATLAFTVQAAPPPVTAPPAGKNLRLTAP